MIEKQQLTIKKVGRKGGKSNVTAEGIVIDFFKDNITKIDKTLTILDTKYPQLFNV